MGIFEVFTSGFGLQTHEWRIQLLRIIVGLAIIAWTLDLISEGGLSRLKAGSYWEFRVRSQRGAVAAQIVSRLYPTVMIARLVAACFFTLGIQPRLLALVVAALLAFDYLHTPINSILFGSVVSASISFAGAAGGAVLPTDGISNNNTLAQFLIACITVQVYWNSAWLKVRSRQFRSGLVLAPWMFALRTTRHNLRRLESTVPHPLVERSGHLTGANIAFWRAVSVGTIVGEVLLPVMLVFDRTRLLGVLVGASMHLAFNTLQFRRLVLLGSTTVGTYVCFGI